jgi:hypothetical protein
MADSKEMKVEEKIAETSAPVDASELTETDFEFVAGGAAGVCVPHCTTLSIQ